MSPSLYAASYLEQHHQEAFRSIMTNPAAGITMTSSPPFEFVSHYPGTNFAVTAHQPDRQQDEFSPYHSYHTASPCTNVAVVSPGSFTWDNRLATLPLADIGAPPSFHRHSDQRPAKRTNMVRFSLQPPRVFTIPNDDEEPREWLQPKDLDRQRNIDRQIGNHVSLDDEYKNSILFLLQSFKAEHYIGRQQLLDHVRVLLKHPEARGLEHRIAVVLKSKRIKAVHKLLRHQQNIRSQERSQIIRALRLRQASLKLSRGARQLAFRLAQSDRLVAKEIHEEQS